MQSLIVHPQTMNTVWCTNTRAAKLFCALSDLGGTSSCTALAARAQHAPHALQRLPAQLFCLATPALQLRLRPALVRRLRISWQRFWLLSFASVVLLLRRRHDWCCITQSHRAMLSSGCAVVQCCIMDRCWRRSAGMLQER